MNWLTDNSFWIVIGIVFVAMHLFGHGRHGGHGGHGRGGGRSDKAPDTEDGSGSDQDNEHRH